VVLKPVSVFPGGFIPSVLDLIRSLETGSQGHLTIDSVTNISMHYVRTLSEWRQRFLNCFDDIIEPALRREHPDVMDEHCGDSGKENIQVFKRKWICEFYFILSPTNFNAAPCDSFSDYFCYCEAGFTTKLLGGEALRLMFLSSYRWPLRRSCNNLYARRLSHVWL
jgi:cyclopropane-fatty-acyl-phospholipid synthase